MSDTTGIKLLGIAGSLREAASSRRLTHSAQQLTRAMYPQISFQLFEQLSAVEAFNEDHESRKTPTGVEVWRDAIKEVDALFIVTPEYNASIPGALKNALDWASRSQIEPFNNIQNSALYGVPVAISSTSNGQFGGAWARDELAKVLRTQGARVISDPALAIPTAHTAFNDNNQLKNSIQQEKLEALIASLIEQVLLVKSAKQQREIAVK